MDKEEIEKLMEELNDHVGKLTDTIIADVYNPKGFINLLRQNQSDAFTTITKMLTPPTKVQFGYYELTKAGKLDLSIEALVLYSKFSCLFSDEVKNEAKRRLCGADPKFAWPDTEPKI